MKEITGKKFYLQIKKGERSYKEEKHCPLILDIMATKGTMAAFCVESLISDSQFYSWVHKYPLFKECYQVGKMISRANWEEEGERGKNDENFNFEHWRHTGTIRYGLGRTNRIRVDVDPEASPFEQYQQLIKQAAGEEFSASEIKQLMESINVGRVVYETFKLQEKIDKMESSVKAMQNNHANNSSTIEKS